MRFFLGSGHFDENQIDAIQRKLAINPFVKKNICDDAPNSKLHRSFPIWQVTVPMSILGTVAMTCVTAIHLQNGSLMMQVDFQENGSTIKVDIDKKGSLPEEAN